MAKRLLAGYRVLDCSRTLGGTHCGMVLADLGAEVIRVENPKELSGLQQWPLYQGVSMVYENMNRNKKGVALDVDTPEGMKAFKKLVAASDVLLFSSMEGKKDRHFLPYEECERLNPRLVYCILSCFGDYGRDADFGGSELVAQAVGGIMSVTGYEGNPPTRAGYPAAETLGGLNASVGIMASLYKREQTGLGQKIDVATADCVVSAEAIHTNRTYYTGKLIPRVGTKGTLDAGPHDSFAAKDGYFILSCNEQRHFEAFVSNAMKMPELATDPRFATREERHANEMRDDPMKKIIEKWASDKSYRECAQRAVDAGAPGAAVNTFADLYADEHIAGTRQMFVEIEDPKAGKVTITGTPMKFADSGITFCAAPSLGQDTREILSAVGYDDAKLDAMRASGTIA